MSIELNHTIVPAHADDFHPNHYAFQVSNDPNNHLMEILTPVA